MNEDEATKVLSVMTGADGGCPFCVRAMFNGFIGRFPEFKEIAERMYREEFERELSDE